MLGFFRWYINHYWVMIIIFIVIGCIIGITVIVVIILGIIVIIDICITIILIDIVIANTIT